MAGTACWADMKLETEGLMQRKKRQVSGSRVSWHAWLCVMRPRTRKNIKVGDREGFNNNSFKHGGLNPLKVPRILKF